MSTSVDAPRSLLRTGLVPAAAAVGATGMNYLLNLLLAARLDPATFGDAALVVNLVLVAGVAAATLQLATSTLIARRDRPDAPAVVAALVRVAVLVGGGLALPVAVFSGPLAAALHVVSPVVFVVLAATLPLFLVQAVHRGALQGRQRSGRLALSYGVEAAVRLASCLLLVQSGAGAVGVAVAVALSMLASACVARTPRERGSSSAGAAPTWAEIRTTAGNALLLLLAQVLLLNTDVLLAKAWFPPSVAGTYAAAALLGRGVFFIGWSVAQSLLPVVAASAAGAPDRRRAFRTLLLTVSGLAGAGTIAAAALAGPAASVLPPAYGATAQLLLPHALAGGALAMASTAAALDLAAGRLGGPVLLIAGAAVHLVALLGSPTDTAGVAWIHAALIVCSATAVLARRSVRTRRLHVVPRAVPSTPTRTSAPTRTGPRMQSIVDRSPTAWRETPEDAPLQLSVVIPAFNEQARIVPTIGAFAAHLAERDLSWELIVSDDGSSDATRDLVALLDHPNVRLVAAPANRGKGAAVRRGLLAARGRLVLFADADNAAPAQELDRLLDAARRGADIAVGSRAADGAQVRNRSLLRSVLTAGLRRTVRLSLGIEVRDTQCGFKLFTAAAARRVAAAQTIDGFAFDLEMLHIAQRLGLVVEEVPVRWFDAPGSKVRPGREVLRFLLSIGRIRLTAVRGGYRHA